MLKTTSKYVSPLRELVTPANLPGMVVASGAALVCILLTGVLRGVSPLLLAIVLGALWRNLLPVPQILDKGFALVARTFLRSGVVLLGLQLSVPAVLSLGPTVLLTALAAVTVTFGATLLLGSLLGVDRDLTQLIAGGFSICGAAAVAGLQGVVRASEEKVASAIALVVLCGTTMIPVSVAIVGLAEMTTQTAGTFIGASVHEVAQVVAAAGIAGGEEMLAVAVPVKLARVILLAPLVLLVSVTTRKNSATTGTHRPPLVPLFVLGFLAAILIATSGWVPTPVLDTAKLLQQFLLAAAMFALGAGVRIRALIGLGWRPLVLALTSTLVIVTTVAVTLGVVSAG